jgi:DDE family transposase
VIAVIAVRARRDDDHEVTKLRDHHREPCPPCHLRLPCWPVASLRCSAALVWPLLPPRRRACWKRSGQVPDPRDPRGRRYRLAPMLAIAVCAVLAGARSYAAIAEWAAFGAYEEDGGEQESASRGAFALSRI